MSPARVFRYDLFNNVFGHTLVLQKDDLCGGCYTSGWEPPQQIESGQTRGFQAESCGHLFGGGFMTGTEGWVKYQIIRDSDQAMRGLVYLYWTNPYFGVTFGRFALATLRWTANCDEDAPDAGSSFSSDEAPPAGFSLSIEGTMRNGSPTDIDELGDLYRVPLAPVFIFGAGGIWENMEMSMKLSSDETPMVFPAPGQHTMSLETQPRRSIVEGHWSSDTVDVDIRQVWDLQYEVNITDTTPGRPFSLATICSFGTAGLAKLLAHDQTLESMVTTSMVKPSHAEIAKASVALSGISAVLRTAGASDDNGAAFLGIPSGRTFSAAALKKQIHDAGVVNSPFLDTLAETAAAHAKESNYTLWPVPDLALQWYRDLEDGHLVGYKLLYQRVLGDGTVLDSQFLTFRPQLH